MMDLNDLRKTIKEVKKQLIVEGGFPRLRQIMLGQVPSVDEIGILTAENPAGVEATSEKNKQLMDDLKKTLRGMKVGYTDVGGSFGGPEKSIFIMNISRDDVTRLGALFDQLAVIWGQKRRDEEDHPFFRFEYIEGNSTKQTRDVSLGDTAIQSRDDFYSEKSGVPLFIFGPSRGYLTSV